MVTRFISLVLVAFGLLLNFGGGEAAAQCSGQAASGSVCAVTGTSPLAGLVTGSAFYDASISSTRGAILERGSGGWTAIVPGTTGLPFVSNGAGADPGYALLSTAGHADQSITNAKLANSPVNSFKCVQANSPTPPTTGTGTVVDCGLQFIVPEECCGAIGDNTTDDRAALQATIDFARTVHIPIRLRGQYRVCEFGGINTSGYGLIIHSAIDMRSIGSGWGSNVPGGAIKPDPACFGAGADVIRIEGTNQNDLNFLHLEGFSIGNPATPTGNRGILIVTTNPKTGSTCNPGSPATPRNDFGYAVFKELTIWDTTSHLGFYQWNGTACPNDFGGMYMSRIENNRMVSALRLELSGPGNVVEHNYIYNNVVGVSIYGSLIGGAVNLNVTRNNVADPGGAIVIDSGTNPTVRENTFELSQTACASGAKAIVDFNGAVIPIVGGSIIDNYLANYSTCPTVLYTVRVNASSDVRVGSNHFQASGSQQNSDPTAFWILVTANATRTWIESAQGGYFYTTLPPSQWVSNGSSTTIWNQHLPYAKYQQFNFASNATLGAGYITGAFNTVLENYSNASTTQTTRTATQLMTDISAALPGYSGYVFRMVNTGNATVTLAGGTGVTITGINTIAANSYRDFVLTFQSYTAATIQSVGSGSK